MAPQGAGRMSMGGQPETPVPVSAEVAVIAALATPPGRGGIGIVRVSGGCLAPFAERLSGKQPRPRQAMFASFRDAAGRAIDAGILIYFPGPHSFTGEDVLELQGHGGPVVMRLLLERCLELGARLAEPGEFTRRAFLNGKLDLAQAEAVADLIEASTAQAARSALRSLSGEFSAAVRGLDGELIDLRSLVEATLDFPDEEIDPLHDTDLLERLGRLRSGLADVLKRSRQGRMLRDGLQVVLAGVPNAGKSSLLNRLAGDERAIVTEVAGTTRDALREVIQIEGIPLHIVDTAGLRETVDPVERIGIERAWREIAGADVILQLVDARVGETADDEAIAARLPAGVKRLVLHNKADLAGAAAERREGDGRVHIVLSAKTGDGVELLQQELLRVVGWDGHGEDVILARERQVAALREAAEGVERAAGQLGKLELCAEELRLAHEALGRITGEFTPDDLLGEIFSRFCVGK
jgi:tRNA modification GTPase